MVIALLLWSALVAATYAFGGVILDFVTPGAAWLQANPDLAVWIEPALGFAGTLGVAAAVIVWLAGVVLILLISRLRVPARVRQSLSYDDWQRQDGGGGSAPMRRRRAWAQAPVRYRDDDDDDDDDRRSRRRRRRDDDDDDD